MTFKTRAEKVAAEWRDSHMGAECEAWAFLAGARWQKRQDIAAVSKDPILVDRYGAADRSQFWKGVLAGQRWAIEAIKGKSK
jgi:hypothetical protein